MKIGIVVASMAAGGAERVALNLAREFSYAGHDVHLVLLRNRGELLRDVPEGVKTVDLGASRARRAIASLRRYVRSERPDILLAINFEINLAVILASIAMRPKPLLVLSVHMPLAPWLEGFAWPRRQIMNLVCRLAYARGDRIVAASNGIARDLVRLGWGRPDQVAAIHNPVLPNDLDSLSREPVDDPWLADPQISCVVTLGRLTKLKNQALLIDAFRRVTERRAARLLIVGEGECRVDLEWQISDSGMSANVRLMGHVAKPFPVLRAADLFVLSSDQEGFGNVLVEAMAVGTPVVSTDCPYGPREILEDGRWGRLVPPREPESLATAILESLDSPGPSAVERAAQFGAAAKSQEYLQLFEAGLKQRSEGRRPNLR